MMLRRKNISFLSFDAGEEYLWELSVRFQGLSLLFLHRALSLAKPGSQLLPKTPEVLVSVLWATWRRCFCLFEQ